MFSSASTIQSEVAIQLSIADEELAIEGKIDILVLHNRLCILLIESKRAAASLEVGLRQLLAYMLASPSCAASLWDDHQCGSFVLSQAGARSDPRIMRCLASSRCAIQDDLYSVWQCSNISSIWCCQNNLRSDNGVQGNTWHLLPGLYR